MTKNLEKTVAGAPVLLQTRGFRLERDSTSVLSAGEPLVRARTLQYMSEPTQERSPMSARSVEKPSATAPTLLFIGESTLD